MKLNTRSRTAINAMLDLAVNGALFPVALASIGERQGVSLSYLEQLFRRLRARGYVKSARGPGGGYQLNKGLSSISVADIIRAVDGQFDGARARPGKRRERNLCPADQLWAQLDRHLIEYLETVSLDDVLAQSRQAADHAPRQPRPFPAIAKRGGGEPMAA